MNLPEYDIYAVLFPRAITVVADVHCAPLECCLHCATWLQIGLRRGPWCEHNCFSVLVLMVISYNYISCMDASGIVLYIRRPVRMSEDECSSNIARLKAPWSLSEVPNAGYDQTAL